MLRKRCFLSRWSWILQLTGLPLLDQSHLLRLCKLRHPLAAVSIVPLCPFWSTIRVYYNSQHAVSLEGKTSLGRIALLHCETENRLKGPKRALGHQPSFCWFIGTVSWTLQVELQSFSWEGSRCRSLWVQSLAAFKVYLTQCNWTQRYRLQGQFMSFCISSRKSLFIPLLESSLFETQLRTRLHGKRMWARNIRGFWVSNWLLFYHNIISIILCIYVSTHSRESQCTVSLKHKSP